MDRIYLTTEALSKKMHYGPRTIRERLKDVVLLEGVHYYRPFGGRKILYDWAAVERDMKLKSQATGVSIPMANGGNCRG